MDAAQQAVDTYRKLAADQPTIFNDRLANSLGILAYSHTDLGQREHALAGFRESVGLYRQYAADLPDLKSNKNLANSLASLSRCLSELGRQEQALEMIREAVDLCQKHNSDNYAAALEMLSKCLGKLGC